VCCRYLSSSSCDIPRIQGTFHPVSLYDQQVHDTAQTVALERTAFGCKTVHVIKYTVRQGKPTKTFCSSVDRLVGPLLTTWYFKGTVSRTVNHPCIHYIVIIAANDKHRCLSVSDNGCCSDQTTMQCFRSSTTQVSPSVSSLNVSIHNCSHLLDQRGLRVSTVTTTELDQRLCRHHCHCLEDQCGDMTAVTHCMPADCNQHLCVHRSHHRLRVSQ